jgi:hypothetical protein
MDSVVKLPMKKIKRDLKKLSDLGGIQLALGLDQWRTLMNATVNYLIL